MKLATTEKLLDIESSSEKIMVISSAKPHFLSFIVIVLWVFLVFAGSTARTSTPAAQTADNCVACHRRDAIVTIYQTSTHGTLGIGCDGCHGGDSSQTDKGKAHAGNFVAKPDTAGTLEMCGKCHGQPLEFFKSSRHVAARPNAARLDCVECHGVHAIGAASDSFRWPQFCAGCHGLEYLPQLPTPFRDMLGLADDLREGLHRLEAKGRAKPEFVTSRKDIRHMISELVHKTDDRAGLERVPGILELGDKLKKQMETEEKR